MVDSPTQYYPTITTRTPGSRRATIGLVLSILGVALGAGALVLSISRMTTPDRKVIGLCVDSDGSYVKSVEAPVILNGAITCLNGQLQGVQAVPYQP